uniref:Uncharacterized protein n=1 Tax=Chromera velia CCMP2878 TaxID=1169474 RepID=A0A0G4I770_9ALVE|eukprot:Cvel_1145.t1-p1 / transcript=Cvel_1145.t1 / gene=Cvel_1145 / organism=Chromera_velia_CCMP2878 / gene_product=hypothetical protein / transcript_product=hypothetical protein / location=Cvel_scaffold38:574-1239(+) / protein_length=222 / sequence_SO=supercontig / SO=protein_coding / is_pseudo=false
MSRQLPELSLFESDSTRSPPRSPQQPSLKRVSVLLSPVLVRDASPLCEDEEQMIELSTVSPTESAQSLHQTSPEALHSKHSMHSPRLSRMGSVAKPDNMLSRQVSFHKTTVTSVLCFEEDASPSCPIRSAGAAEVGRSVETFVENKVKGPMRDEEVRKIPKRKNRATVTATVRQPPPIEVQTKTKQSTRAQTPRTSPKSSKSKTWGGTQGNRNSSTGTLFFS